MAGSTQTLITVAPTGAEAEKSAVPALPVTLDELVVTAKECESAGAAVIHVHIRDETARPTLDRRGSPIPWRRFARVPASSSSFPPAAR